MAGANARCLRLVWRYLMSWTLEVVDLCFVDAPLAIWRVERSLAMLGYGSACLNFK